MHIPVPGHLVGAALARRERGTWTHLAGRVHVGRQTPGPIDRIDLIGCGRWLFDPCGDADRDRAGPVSPFEEQFNGVAAEVARGRGIALARRRRSRPARPTCSAGAVEHRLDRGRRAPRFLARDGGRLRRHDGGLSARVCGGIAIVGGRATGRRRGRARPCRRPGAPLRRLGARRLPARAGAGRSERDLRRPGTRAVRPVRLPTSLANPGTAAGYSAMGAFSMRTESFLWRSPAPPPRPGLANGHCAGGVWKIGTPYTCCLHYDYVEQRSGA